MGVPILHPPPCGCVNTLFYLSPPLAPLMTESQRFSVYFAPIAGHQRPAIERLGIRDRVHFTGWVDEADKPALYSMALGSVFVSEYEGFGLPVVEGMAAAGQLDRDR